jgi:hypothetical protein
MWRGMAIIEDCGVVANCNAVPGISNGFKRVTQLRFVLCAAGFNNTIPMGKQYVEMYSPVAQLLEIYSVIVVLKKTLPELIIVWYLMC